MCCGVINDNNQVRTYWLLFRWGSHCRYMICYITLWEIKSTKDWMPAQVTSHSQVVFDIKAVETFAGGEKNPLGISYLMNSHHLVVISLQCPLKAITAQLWHLHTNTPRSLSELLAWHYHVSTYSKNGWREPLGNDYLNAWQTRMQTKLPSWWWSLKPTSPRAPQEKILSRDLRSDWGCVEHLPLQVQWPWNGFRLWCYILRWALPFWKLTWMYNIQCTHFMCQTDIAT